MDGSITQGPKADAAEIREATVPAADAGRRLDQALAGLFPDFSRTRLGDLAREGRVRIDGVARRASWRVAGGERVVLALPPDAARGADRPEPLPLAVVYEDPDLFVLDKPPGLTVHPGAGRPSGTLLNALLARDPALAALPRAGLVHRLDRDTSGLLLVARRPRAYRSLVAALAVRAIHRRYDALVWGTPPAQGLVDAPLGRHPAHRTRRAVVPGGRPARTHFTVVGRAHGIARLAVRIETGRTHQIRVHLAHRGHPVVGDPVYGGVRPPPASLPAPLRELLGATRRQMLHASRLELAHPRDARPLVFSVPPPADMVALIEALGLREEAGRG